MEVIFNQAVKYAELRFYFKHIYNYFTAKCALVAFNHFQLVHVVTKLLTVKRNFLVAWLVLALKWLVLNGFCCGFWILINIIKTYSITNYIKTKSFYSQIQCNILEGKN